MTGIRHKNQLSLKETKMWETNKNYNLVARFYIKPMDTQKILKRH